MTHAVSITLGLCVLLSGCISQPTSPREKADAAAAMGLILMATAAQEKGSTASGMFQVRIPPPALEVLSRILVQRRNSNNWPTREEVALPEGVTDLILQPVEEGLAVVMKKDEVVVIRCRILNDGTVVAIPVIEELVSAMQKRPSPSAPKFPVLPLPRD
ncbi:MAG: hypothetical protein JNL39_17575 [Opitutaceae bacterium]|nr:hypothetical protein [Opitutaceae bacterium]